MYFFTKYIFYKGLIYSNYINNFLKSMRKTFLALDKRIEFFFGLVAFQVFTHFFSLNYLFLMYLKILFMQILHMNPCQIYAL